MMIHGTSNTSSHQTDHDKRVKEERIELEYAEDTTNPNIGLYGAENHQQELQLSGVGMQQSGEIRYDRLQKPGTAN